MKSAESSLIESIVRLAPSTLLALDYDGSLAPIVDDPEAALPVPGAIDALARLTGALGRVLIVSGRPISFLERHIPNGIDVTGLYGLEGIVDGRRWEHPEGAAWRGIIGGLAARAVNEAPDGLRVESKGLSITFHFREHPDIAERCTAWAAAEAVVTGLHMRHARMSVEMHPPIDVDKGTVIEAAASDASLVVFAGDDVGDLTAFDALDRLAARGVECRRVAVSSTESPDELIARADLEIDGPPGVAVLLAQLVEAISAAAS